MFKVGDRVRRKTPSEWPVEYGYVGEEFIVTNVDKMCITMRSPTNSRSIVGANCYAFELVQQAPETSEIDNTEEFLDLMAEYVKAITLRKSSYEIQAIRNKLKENLDRA